MGRNECQGRGRTLDSLASRASFNPFSFCATSITHDSYLTEPLRTTSQPFIVSYHSSLLPLPPVRPLPLLSSQPHPFILFSAPPPPLQPTNHTATPSSSTLSSPAPLSASFPSRLHPLTDPPSQLRRPLTFALSNLRRLFIPPQQTSPPILTTSSMVSRRIQRRTISRTRGRLGGRRLKNSPTLRSKNQLFSARRAAQLSSHSSTITLTSGRAVQRTSQTGRTTSFDLTSKWSSHPTPLPLRVVGRQLSTR